MAMNRDGLKTRILTYLTANGYKPTKYTNGLAEAIAKAVIDEIQTNATVDGGVVPTGGGAIAGAKVY